MRKILFPRRTTTKALQPFVKSITKTTPPTSIQHGANPQETSELILSESIDYLIMGYLVRAFENMAFSKLSILRVVLS
jgi:hypothetical protein